MTCPRCGSRVFLHADELYCHNCGSMPLPAEQARIDAIRRENAAKAGDTRRFRGGIMAASVIECGRTKSFEWGTVTTEEVEEIFAPFVITQPRVRWECLGEAEADLVKQTFTDSS